MSKNILDPGRSRMITWRIRVACWIPKTTETHSEYVVLITDPLQQGLPTPQYYVLRTLPISVHEITDEAIQLISADVNLYGNKYN
jgi:hypothetical protein